MDCTLNKNLKVFIDYTKRDCSSYNPLNVKRPLFYLLLPRPVDPVLAELPGLCEGVLLFALPGSISLLAFLLPEVVFLAPTVCLVALESLSCISVLEVRLLLFVAIVVVFLEG